MKVKSVSSHILRAPLGAQKFYSSQAAFPERNSSSSGSKTNYRSRRLGRRRPVWTARAGRRLRRRCFCPAAHRAGPNRTRENLGGALRVLPRLRAEGNLFEAISAIDIALWDISGQAAGLPVWKMLGGRFRDSVTAYATGCYYPDNFRDMPAVLRALEKEARATRTPASSS